MKHPYLNFRTFCLISLLCCQCLTVYSQDILWEKSFGGVHAEYLFDAQPTADYGFILAGSSLSDKSGNKEENNQGDLDYWVWKMDENGNLDWQKSFGGNGFDLLQSIKNTNDGGFILAGTSSSNPLPVIARNVANGEAQVGAKKDSCRGVTDFWVIKLNAAGEEQWQRTLGGSGQDEVLTVFQTRDGGFMVGGSSSSSPQPPPKEGEQATEGIVERTDLYGNNNSNINGNEKMGYAKPDLYGKSEKSRGNMDYWIVKLDKNGELQWQKTYGGEYADLLRSMEQTKDGGYILGGYSNSPQSGEKADDIKGIGDYWILKIDAVGKIEWQQTYGGNGDNQLYAIHQTQDGGYIAGGNSNSTETLTAMGGRVSNGTDYWVIKMDENGGIVWSKTYDFGKVDILTSLVENKDHTYLVGGYSSSPLAPEGGTENHKKVKVPEGINDYIALKIDDSGEVLWEQTVGSDGEDILKKMIETRDGGYLMAGTSSGKASGDKKTAMGSNDFWVVKIKDKEKPLREKTTSIEAIPNPTASFTNIIIGYEFEKGTATVVDIAGRVLQQFPITSRTVPVDLSQYPDGVYIVNIKTKVQSDGVKIIKSGGN